MRDQYIFAELTWRSRRGPGSEGTSVRLVKMVGLIVKNFNWMCDEFKLLFKICSVSVQVFFHLTATFSSCKLPAVTEVPMLWCLISIICRNQDGCISEPLFLTAISASLQMFSGFDEDIFLQQWFSKSKPQTQSMRVTWKHIRNANHQGPPPQTYLIRNPWRGWQAGKRAICVSTDFRGLRWKLNLRTPALDASSSDVWSMDPQHPHCLGACEKHEISSLTSSPTESTSAF